jgi:hypothetical protein
MANGGFIGRSSFPYCKPPPQIAKMLVQGVHTDKGINIMQSKIVGKFIAEDDAGTEFTICIWQDYHQISGNMHSGPRWVPDALKKLLTSNGDTVSPLSEEGRGVFQIISGIRVIRVTSSDPIAQF